jgi:hypothetical protein
MGRDRSCGWLAALTGALVLAVGVVVAGCGGGNSPKSGPVATSASTPTATSTQTTPAAPAQSSGPADRGATRCTRTAFLAALLADVAQLPFLVDRVRCQGGFGRSRFVARGCAPGQTAGGVACGSAKVAAWRRGAKRWRLIAYADTLSCAAIRAKAKDFPQSLCD